MPNNRFVDSVIGDRDEALYVLAAPCEKLFRSFLSDGTDTDLTDNYSAATDAFVAFTRPAVVTRCTIRFTSSTLAQNVTSTVLGAIGSDALDGELFLGGIAALTNGLKFRIENSAGTIKLDISDTVGLKTLGQIAGICTYHQTLINDSAASAAANSATFVGYIDFKELFGRAITVNNGDRFVCVLQDDFSTATNTEFQISISGFYL
jgi:hypothetical protein